MIKTVLVPMGGSDSDAPVLESAWEVARGLNAHLDCLHVRLDSGTAAQYMPHLDFLVGPALQEALQKLNDEGRSRSATARRHFDAFCRQHAIGNREQPGGPKAATAAWREDSGSPLEILMRSARHHDLVVIGRRAGANGLPSDLTERLLLESGRPLLIASDATRAPLMGTALLFWKERAEAAHALAAALPLLQRVGRAVLIQVPEDGSAGPAVDLREVQVQLAWHGVHAEVESVAADGRGPARLIEDLVRGHGAGLIVMGGYGRHRFREVLFGGWTQAVLGDAGVPVLVAH